MNEYVIAGLLGGLFGFGLAAVMLIGILAWLVRRDAYRG